MERKIAPSDQPLIRQVVTDLIIKLKRSNRKAMYAYLDADSALLALNGMDYVYIIEEQFLVVYDFVSPWYAKPDTLWLAELLVLRIAVGGAKDFSVVTTFLERRAREAGCGLVVAGTALAKADNALASLYIKHGFTAETITLTKEPNGISV